MSLLLFCVLPWMLSFCQFKDTLPISADSKAILTSPSVALKALAGQRGRPRHLKSSSSIFNYGWQVPSHLIKLTARAEGSAPAVKRGDCPDSCVVSLAAVTPADVGALRSPANVCSDCSVVAVYAQKPEQAFERWQESSWNYMGIEAFEGVFQPQLKNPKHVGGQSFNCYVLEMEDNDEYLKYKMSTERVGSQTGDKPSMASLKVCKQIAYRPEACLHRRRDAHTWSLHGDSLKTIFHGTFLFLPHYTFNV